MNKIILPLILFLLVIGGVVYAITNRPSHSKSVNSKPVSPSVEPSVSVKQYTLSEVTAHKNESSCWSVINGKVYDLTTWVGQHPGGSERILSICGKDGSSAFNSQHGNQPQPESILNSFYIGTIK